MFGVSSGLLVLLLLFNGGCSVEVKDGEKVEIPCDPKDPGPTVWWFRLKDNEMIEFIAAFNSMSMAKKSKLEERYSEEKIKNKILTLKAFNKEDSGSYSCMSIKNNELLFGKVTRLQRPTEPVTERNVPITRAAHANPTVQTTPFESRNKAPNSLGCKLIILIPLAASSGLLLILLIIIILYCNSIRTRRCPHHHKRKPRNRPAGHRPLPHQPDF